MGEANQLKQRGIKGLDAKSSKSHPDVVSTPDIDKASKTKPARFLSFVSTPKIAILIFGVFFGNMILPIIVVETSNFMSNSDMSSAEQPSESSTKRSLRILAEEESINVNNRMKHLIEDKMLLSTQSLPTDRAPLVMETPRLSDHRRKKILVTGGAGFVGSHLVDKLMMEGHEVTVVDNLFTGQKKNVAHWFHHPNFNLVVHDVTEPIHLEVDEIYHLACPASPPHYQFNPVKTIKTSTMGTLNMLGLAKRVKAKILLTSTSEIYGDPQVHPQSEDYWGNVNPIGPRSCYDEGKRVAETMMYSYKNQNNVPIRIARIFNTFGPRMHPNDGRVVSNFIIQALQGKPLTVYGEGEQTRSFQYVSDLVDGLHALMNHDYDGPVNLGNPDEFTMKEFAEYIKKLTKSDSIIQFLDKTQDDPSKRRPDISLAKRVLGWSPKVPVEEGLTKTIEYFQSVLDEAGEIIPTGPGASKPQN
ncbi:nucleoside-diphosphate-sugar epimerase [Nitzschia inconspicua]|uniref:Nucleoside-diphosphate-sugar epimerase n=1 Tax=Nitzschia inconspicua TaxID=303405 RepID=A0A9K3M1K3_9STRA|nr:nucleoside-diphosphate-sugar epimerase [Nitzschia inconspicua]